MDAIIYTRDDTEYDLIKEMLEKGSAHMDVYRHHLNGHKRYDNEYDIVIVALKGAEGINPVSTEQTGTLAESSARSGEIPVRKGGRGGTAKERRDTGAGGNLWSKCPKVAGGYGNCQACVPELQHDRQCDQQSVARPGGKEGACPAKDHADRGTQEDP